MLSVLVSMMAYILGVLVYSPFFGSAAIRLPFVCRRAPTETMRGSRLQPKGGNGERRKGDHRRAHDH